MKKITNDVYKGFDHTKYPRDLQGWSNIEAIAMDLISFLKPNLIIEVGTWKGKSAITMASILKVNKIKAKIICVDTWLGGLEHLNKIDCEIPAKKAWYDSLNHRHGYPTLYYQFLANVCYANCQEYIIPLANTSHIAGKFLAAQKIQADLIYIDGSHEYEDVKKDIQLYRDILKPGGIMFGDDYTWQGVQKAVSETLKHHVIVDKKFWKWTKAQ